MGAAEPPFFMLSGEQHRELVETARRWRELAAELRDVFAAGGHDDTWRGADAAVREAERMLELLGEPPAEGS